MSIYTVHEPPLKADEIHAGSRSFRVRARRLLVLGASCWRRCGCCAIGCGWCSSATSSWPWRSRSDCGSIGASSGVIIAVSLLLALAGRLRGRDVASLHPGAPALEQRRHRRRRRSRIGRAAVLRRMGRQAVVRSSRPTHPLPAADRVRRLRRAWRASLRVIRGHRPVSRNRERRGERRDRRLRLGQSAFGGEGVRARRARERIERSRSW